MPRKSLKKRKKRNGLLDHSRDVRERVGEGCYFKEKRSKFQEEEEDGFRGFTENEIKCSVSVSARVREELLAEGFVGGEVKKRVHPPPSCEAEMGEGGKAKKKKINIFTDNLIVEGKRRWKPTLKAQEGAKTIGLIRNHDHTDKEAGETPSKMSGVISSNWKSRLKNHETEVSLRPFSPVKEDHQLDPESLERLKSSSNQIEFYSAIQESIQNPEATPPRLIVIGLKNSCINPAGTALIDDRSEEIRLPKNRSAQIPGNVVCGICGALRYFECITRAKKFGTFSCEPCQNFATRIMRKCREGTRLFFECIKNTGKCLVHPISPNIIGTSKGKTDDTRCEACWLKLCLIGYNLDTILYDKLRKVLPLETYRSLLPDGCDKAGQFLIPHKGEILEFNSKFSLSRPLFDRFGDLGYDDGNNKVDCTLNVKTAKDEPVNDKNDESPSLEHNIVIENLPDGWKKKMEKRSKECWNGYLIAPDQTALHTNTELELYVAKTGIIVEPDIINFIFSPKTKLDDKTIKSNTSVPVVAKKSLPVRIDEEETKVIEKDKDVKAIPLSTVSSSFRPRRRESRVPLKFRDDEMDFSFMASKVDNNSNDFPLIGKKRKWRSSDANFPILNENFNPIGEKRPPYFARKQTLEALGVDSLPLNETIPYATVEGKSLTKRLKNRRCGECVGCKRKNCGKCYRCQDMICHGGPGIMKQACIERACKNPQTPVAPSSKSSIHRSPKKTLPKIEPVDRPREEIVSPPQKNIPSSPASLNIKEPKSLSVSVRPIHTKGRPKCSYSALIAIALQNLPDKRGTLSMIYEFIKAKFPYFKNTDKIGWQNSIRHNLSLNKCFVRTGRTDKDGVGKGSFWIIDPEKIKNGSLRGIDKLMESEESILEDEPLKESELERSFSAEEPSASEVKVEKESSGNIRESLENFLKIGLEDKASTVAVKSRINLGSIDFWEQYDPDVISKNGLGIITTSKLPTEALCFLCGSAGKDQVLIHCSACCEPFHPFCVDPGDAPKDDEADDWVCRRCAVCQACGQPDGKQLKCYQCRHAYHESCLRQDQKRFIEDGHPWVCSYCLRCHSCGKTDVAHYSGDVPLCSFCCLQKKRGSFCPLCEGCYDDDDYETKMMECGQCGGWVHASCEGVDAEKYQILSCLPDTVEYICKKCTNDKDEAKWMLAIKSELRNGQHLILNALLSAVSYIGKNNPSKKIIHNAVNIDIPDWIKLKACSVVIKDLKDQSSYRKIMKRHELKSSHKSVEKKQKPSNDIQARYLKSKKEDRHIVDLFKSIKKKLSDGEYKTLFYLDRDIKRALASVCEDTTELKNSYKEALKRVFPWFDIGNPSSTYEPITIEDKVVLPPWYGDHSYSDCFLRYRKKQKTLEDYIRRFDKIHPLRSEDTRKCGFCSETGDCEISGRLLYYRHNEFVHVNCVLWSSEVYEEVDGGLQNVHIALCRASKMACTFCKEKGATIGCCNEDCASNYHFPCGLKAEAEFKKDKTVYCSRHKSLHNAKEKATDLDFLVLRTVHIDLELDSRKKMKLVNLNDIRFQVGSLTVESLGFLDFEISDNITALIPLQLKCSRLFWSVKDPSKIVKYHCCTKLIRQAGGTSFEEPHFLYDHEDRNQNDFRKKLVEFFATLEKYRMKTMKKEPSVILPPNSTYSHYKSLSSLSVRDDSWRADPYCIMDDTDITSIEKITSSSSVNAADSISLFTKTDQQAMECNFNSHNTSKFKVQEFKNGGSEITPLMSIHHNELERLSDASVQCSLPFYLCKAEAKKEGSCSLDCSLEKNEFTHDIVDFSTKAYNAKKMKENYIPSILQNMGSVDITNQPKLEHGSGIFIFNNDCKQKPKKKKGILLSGDNIQTKILQCDGAFDNAYKINCPKCNKSFNDSDAYECHTIKCQNVASSHSSIERKSDSPTPKGDSGETSSRGDEISPRKDFSIKGLLSPPTDEHQQPEHSADNNLIVIDDDDDDDDVVFISQHDSKGDMPSKSPHVKTSRVNCQHPTLNDSIYIQPIPQPGVLPEHYLQPRPGFSCINASFQVGSFVNSFYQGASQTSNIVAAHQPSNFGYLAPTGLFYNQNSFVATPQPQSVLYSQQPCPTNNVFGYSFPTGLGPPIVPHSLSSPAITTSVSSTSSSKKKVARVYPQPVVATEESLLPSSATSSSVDPIKDLSTLIPSRTVLSVSDSKTSSKPYTPFDENELYKQRSVGTQARLGNLSKCSTSSTPIESVELRPGSATSGTNVLILKPPQLSESGEPYIKERIENGILFTGKHSKTDSIKITLERQEEKNIGLKIQEIFVKDGSLRSNKLINPKEAIQALRTSLNRDSKQIIVSDQNEFINEIDANTKAFMPPQFWRPHEAGDFDENSKISFEITSDEGFKAESFDVNEIWYQVFEAVQDARIQQSMSPLPNTALQNAGLQMLGLTHNALAYILEQFPEVETTEKYRFKYRLDKGGKYREDTVIKENASGCARTEAFKERAPFDMFSWLASKHRKRPNLVPRNQEIEPVSVSRRATSLDLPMAMRFRHLAKNAKEAVGVFTSGIHGRGLYCKREIQAGEMVIEYAGEEIRAILTDKRETHYESRGIGCYMFRIDDDTVIDATMKGNAARFINHSCDPNCYSKIVDIFGKKHIIIFALRRIIPGEELTYDYKFPIEDVKLPCTCGKKKCRKYMN